MEKINIVICGGHLSPALAVIEVLQKRKEYRLFYIGRKSALEGQSDFSLEYQTITAKGIKFLGIQTGRFQRHLSLWKILLMIKMPIGIFQSLYLMLRIRPRLILSFGSYVALPVCFIAWILGIPIITHEQTLILGLSNRFISRMANVLCISFSGTKYVPKGVKTIVTGLPVRKSFFYPKKNDLLDFGNKRLPLIYITGGSTGSQSINSIVSMIMNQLTEKYRVLHQCGSADSDRDYKVLHFRRNLLPEKNKFNYLVVKHINIDLIGIILQNSNLVISRSGANTVAEIALTGVPAILIPLPWSANQEQEYNARMLAVAGLAKIIH
ncbi:hypothetical protein A2Y99_01185, partial [Candidatus Gottesmanbacteria bacterium RBG_13_37_7]